ncbi:MAG: type IV pilus assembly protein PilM [Bdellovibrionales bacterium]|nr:type IV pilus assembly protein PilM [Bdellovibrionales bacterium]
MDLSSLFQRREQLISLDIGASSVKLVELELSGSGVKLLNIGSMPIEGEVFTSNVISKKDKVADAISALLEAHGVDDKRVITCVPGPTVFTKKIKTPQVPYPELVANVNMEAANFIPHNIDAVRLDFHILKEVGKNQFELLVVAVKNEVIDAVVETLSLAGLEAAIIDVDYFALQNIFEHSYPEYLSSTVALVDFGARYSSVNIVQGGSSLFTGDVSAGGRTVVEALQESLELTRGDAEALVQSGGGDGDSQSALQAEVETLAKEFNRQLSFFWSAAGADQGIDRIMLSGGAAQTSGFISALEEITGLPCEQLDPYRNIDTDGGFDDKLLKQLAPSVGVAFGMALREPGDRILPEDL